MANKKVTNQEVKKVETISTETSVENTATESVKVTIDNVTILNVTSPSTIMRIAQEKGINPQEVFVRCNFEYKNQQFVASNKLRFLTKTGYTELLNAKEEKTPMKLVVDVTKAFFYIEHDVAVDSLFDTPIATEDTRSSLASLLNS